MAQVILGQLLQGHRDGVGAYYRSRPLLLALGLTLEDALGSPLGRAGGFSDGRDIGVVCNLPTREGAVVLPMSGDVGSQFTPTAGWAQAITYHRDVLSDPAYKGAIGVALGGDAAVATNGFWSALTMATTLKLPVLFYIEDNDLGISVKGEMQTPGGNIARNLASFANLTLFDGDGTDPETTANLLTDAVARVRGGTGPALVHLTVPRLSSHSGPDNQKGYRTEKEIAADHKRDPLPRLRSFLVPSRMTAAAWSEIETEVARDVDRALTAARTRRKPNPAKIADFVYAYDAPGAPEALGGLTREERSALGGTDTPKAEGELLRVAEAIRRTLRHELSVNPKVVVFGEDVGKKGGVHLVTEGLQKEFGAQRVFDTSLSEEGIIGRASGMAISGLMPVAENPVPQVRRPGHRAAQQHRHAALAHGQPVCRADGRPDAGWLRQGRGRSVAFAVRRGALCARIRVAGGDAVQCGGRRGAAACGDAEPQPHDLLRASVAPDDRRRQRALPR